MAAFLVKTYARIKKPITAIGTKIEIKTIPAVDNPLFFFGLKYLVVAFMVVLFFGSYSLLSPSSVVFVVFIDIVTISELFKYIFEYILVPFEN